MGRFGFLVGAMVAVGWCFEATTQIEPDPRQLFQLAYNQPLEGRAPIAAYGFYYHNHPGFLRTNVTLRLAVAPIYLDTELGVSGLLGPNTDLALGVAGGGFADTYSEIRRGTYRKGESFTGHGGEISTALYHRFNPEARVPLYWVSRVGAHHSLNRAASRKQILISISSPSTWINPPGNSWRKKGTIHNSARGL